MCNKAKKFIQDSDLEEGLAALRSCAIRTGRKHWIKQVDGLIARYNRNETQYAANLKPLEEYDREHAVITYSALNLADKIGNSKQRWYLFNWIWRLPIEIRLTISIPIAIFIAVKLFYPQHQNEETFPENDFHDSIPNSTSPIIDTTPEPVVVPSKPLPITWINIKAYYPPSIADMKNMANVPFKIYLGKKTVPVERMRDLFKLKLESGKSTSLSISNIYDSCHLLWDGKDSLITRSDWSCYSLKSKI